MSVHIIFNTVFTMLLVLSTPPSNESCSLFTIWLTVAPDSKQLLHLYGSVLKSMIVSFMLNVSQLNKCDIRVHEGHYRTNVINIHCKLWVSLCQFIQYSIYSVYHVVDVVNHTLQRVLDIHFSNLTGCYLRQPTTSPPIVLYPVT